MIRAFIAGLVVAIGGATAAVAAVPTHFGASEPRLEARDSGIDVAQGPVTLPRGSRCPTTSPPSHQRFQRPYVIWICNAAGGTQFDYYLGESYVYSLTVPR